MGDRFLPGQGAPLFQECAQIKTEIPSSVICEGEGNAETQRKRQKLIPTCTGNRLPNVHGRFRGDERRVREMVLAQAGAELRGGQGAAEGGGGGDGVCGVGLSVCVGWGEG